MRRGFFVLICSVILFLASFIFPLTNIQVPADSLLSKFKDSATEKILEVPDYDTSFELVLPADIEVLNATMKLSFVDYNNYYPFNPQLIIGNTSNSKWLKSIWAFDERGYGAFGHQEYFKDNTLQKEIVYKEAEDNSDLRIYLPSTAEISSAKLNLTASAFDHWSDDLLELNPEPDGAGDYEPELILFKGSLFTVFRSYNSVVTNGSDSDIVINSTSDGVNWSGMKELRSEPDSSPPYNNPYESADWRPTLEKFNNKLYCAWESNSTITTDGQDRDIILRSSSDGIAWSSNVINVTDTWENDYSNNPGLKNDWDPDMAMFNNSLWLVWVTNNTGSEGGFENPANDIMISNSSDGVIWRNATDLTSGDDWFTNDVRPQLVVFNSSLYLIWSSNNTQLNKGNNDELDYDIIYRYTSDGVTWSAPQVLNPNDNDPLTKMGSDDLQPTVIVAGNRLYCAWVSDSIRYTEGIDYDIMLAYSDDGNLTELQNYYEVTAESNGYSDFSPKLAVFDNRIYIIWVNNVDENYEILIRYFSPANNQFGFEQQVNPIDNGGDDYWPQALSFNNKMYSVWVSSDSRTGTGLDRDIILRDMQPSFLPLEIGMDVGGDDSWDIPLGTQLMGNTQQFDLTSGFQQVLSDNDWVLQNSTIRSFGNRICEIPLNVHFSNPGRLIADELDIIYNCSFQVSDFSDDFNRFITQNRNDITKNGKLVIPFTITSSASLGKIKVSDVRIIYNHLPEISIDEIPEVGKQIHEPVYRIQWTASDPDDNASISLYYDLDDQNHDGVLITSNLSEDSSLNYFDWVWWQELPEGGTVYIYANISDGNNYYQNYSSGPLILEELNIHNFIDISIVEPDGINDDAWDTYVIRWSSYCPNENAKITLFYDNNSTGFDGFAIDINENGFFDPGDFISELPNDGLGEYTWDITNRKPGNNYYIYAKITNQWNISIYNYSSGPVTRSHMPAPREFTLIDDIDPLDDNLTTHKKNPQLSWLRPETDITDNLEYKLNVWQGSDNTGELVYNVTTVATGATILNGLEFGHTYYSEVFGYTADGRRSMKTGIAFTLINNKPTAPVITITPVKPVTTDTLLCSIRNESFDEDLDTINYTFQWYKDGQEQSAFKNLKNVPAEDTAKGERWRCVVIPFDTLEYGPNATAEVLIRNSAPTINIIKPESGKEYKDSEAIFFNFSVTDADSEDRDHLSYKVYSGQNELRSGYVPSIRGRVEFYQELAKGTHNLRFNISDGETSIEVSQEITIKGREDADSRPVVLYGFYAIIIIIVIFILIFTALLLQIRRLRGEVAVDEEEEIPEELEDAELEEEELTEEEPELAEEDLEEEEIEEEGLEE
jgi:hypothetical protein